MGDGPRAILASKSPQQDTRQDYPGPGQYTLSDQNLKSSMAPKLIKPYLRLKNPTFTGVTSYLLDCSSLSKIGTRIGFSRKFSE